MKASGGVFVLLARANANDRFPALPGARLAATRYFFANGQHPLGENAPHVPERSLRFAESNSAVPFADR